MRGEISYDYQSATRSMRAGRQERLVRDARSAFRAMDGWSRVKSQEDWHEALGKAAEDLDEGGFFIDRLGAERHLDPDLMAVLLVLRRRLIDDCGGAAAAELMYIDLAVLSYYHTMRINGWIGNLASVIESEFFQKEGLNAKFQDRYGRGSHRIDGLDVEDHVRRIGEQLFPLLDRCNRMMLRNLKALRELRQGPAPSVSINRAAQVNVAGQQVNTTTHAEDGAALPEQ